MPRRAFIPLFVALCFYVSTCPAHAVASCWPLADDRPIILAFDARYVASTGEEWTHRGVDIGADSGEEVLTCLAGTVVFAGSVPAGERATTIAVTVQSEDGSRFTFMPLLENCVSEGERVEAGQALGVLAATGDPSSSSPHLHVSRRVADKYEDPMDLLAPPLSAQPDPKRLTDQRLPEPEAVPADIAPRAEANLGDADVETGFRVASGVASKLPHATRTEAPHAPGIASSQAQRTPIRARDVARRYETCATRVVQAHREHRRLAAAGMSVPWAIIVAAALALAIWFGRRSLLSSRRPGESEVAAAVGR